LQRWNPEWNRAGFAFPAKFGGKRVNLEENQHLFVMINQIVPRHWDYESEIDRANSSGRTPAGEFEKPRCYLNLMSATISRTDRLKARLFHWPTLFWTLLMGRVLKRRHWWDRMDSTVLLGAQPFSNDVAGLIAENVCGVVNMCEEYAGPEKTYRESQIEVLRVPVFDYTHPTLAEVIRAVEFIERYAREESSVYVHCKAGRGRSATVVLCWLIKSQQITKEKAHQKMLAIRPFINPRLPSRPVVIEFERKYLRS
jgi:atypical dual specificity phosphatase